MITGLSDTDPAAEAVQCELIRQAPVWRRIELMLALNRTVRQMALSGLQARYPGADDAEIKRRLADLLLGEELAAKAYGPPDYA